jgi:hypothetical protein
MKLTLLLITIIVILGQTYEAKLKQDKVINPTKETTENKPVMTTPALKPYSTRLKDYFVKTSEQNQIIAWQSLSSFVLGLILFFMSIQVICWNERRAVKDTEILDHFIDTEKSVYMDKIADVKLDSDYMDKLFIVCGNLSVKEEASIANSCVRIKHTYGKVALIKIFHETFSVQTETNESGETTYIKKWSSKIVNTHSYSVRNSQLSIADKFLFDPKHIDDVITSSDYYYMENMNDNIHTHIPKDTELKEMCEWIRPTFNGPFESVTDHGGFVYALHGSRDSSMPFEPCTYDFKEGDERLIIKYVYTILY